MKNLKNLFAAALLFSLFLSACHSPQKMLDTGNYDDIIQLSIKKVAGKKKKDPQYVSLLETAFEKATKEDMRHIESLKRSGRADIWEQVLATQEDIKRRQNKIKPLLPLIDKEGYQANFSFVRIDDMLVESRTKAAEYYYVLGQRLVENARNGNKNDARAAFDYFSKTQRFFDNYRDRQSLMNEMHDLGIIHVLYTTKNSSNSVLPASFERELMNVSVKDFDTFWKKYYSQKNPNIRYDFRVEMNITTIGISPETLREREYVDHKEIKDGFTYVLDQNGNVLKDSLGNDIKVDRFVFIEAVVFETYQHKEASVKGYLEYFDAQTNERIYSDALNAVAIFDNYASTFRGDRRALSNDSRRRIGNTPLPFPSNEQLILQAANSMKPIIKEKMARRDMTPRTTVVADN